MTDFATEAICHAAEMVKASIQSAAAQYENPSVLFRPRLFLDGNKYCALYGENLMEGCAGFGDTPQQAMEDFDRNWLTMLAPMPFPKPPAAEANTRKR